MSPYVLVSPLIYASTADISSSFVRGVKCKENKVVGSSLGIDVGVVGSSEGTEVGVVGFPVG
jgi:hypothetical protein